MPLHAHLGVDVIIVEHVHDAFHGRARVANTRLCNILLAGENRDAGKSTDTDLSKALLVMPSTKNGDDQIMLITFRGKCDYIYVITFRGKTSLAKCVAGGFPETNLLVSGGTVGGSGGWDPGDDSRRDHTGRTSTH